MPGPPSTTRRVDHDLQLRQLLPGRGDAIQVSALAFVVATLAVWRVTHLLWGEDGPADVFVRLHRAVRRWPLGRVFDCFYCLSVWVAAPVALWLATPWIERAIVWLGLSGGAILLERATTRPPPPPPPAAWRHDPAEAGVGAPRSRDEEDDHVLLR